MTRALLTALVLLAALPARAECRAQGDEIVCDRATLEAVRAESVACQRDLRIARADVKLADAKADALAVELARVKALPPPETTPLWQSVGAGVLAGVTLTALTLLVLSR